MTEDGLATTRFEKVVLYTQGRDQKYGYTKLGSQTLRIVTNAMKAGNTVSLREYYHGDQRVFDAEIIWDAHLN